MHSLNIEKRMSITQQNLDLNPPKQSQFAQANTALETLTIETTRFGTITVTGAQLLQFVSPIIGFESVEYYALLDHADDSPFKWLQAVNDPDLAFVVTNPILFGFDYAFELPTWAANGLNITQTEQATIYTLVTIPEDNPRNMTANFLAPVIVNVDTHCAMQLVLQDTTLQTRVKLLPDDAP